MTRAVLIAGLLATPIATGKSVAADKERLKTILLPSGVYRIARGGGIHIVGDDVYIRGCVFEGCTVQDTAARF